MLLPVRRPTMDDDIVNTVMLMRERWQRGGKGAAHRAVTTS